MTVNAAANPGRHALSERKDDLYETPTEATLALLRAERLPHFLWECASGRGAIVRVLRAAGHDVTGSDLVDYGEPTHFHGRDFLMEQRAPDNCQGIVTNPPFKLANQFVAHALTLCPLVVMLLRLAFLESEGRRGILDNGYLARVHVFRNRLPMMHRDGFSRTSKLNSSSIPFAWFVWDRNHQGPTELRRVSWEQENRTRL